MIKEIVPDVFELRVPIPHNPLGYLLAYLVRGDEGFIMVDAGWPGRQALDYAVDALRQAGIPPKRLIAIILTHGHPDHFGIAGRLRDLTGARIVMHQKEAASLRELHSDPPAFGAEAREGWLRSHGVPESELAHLRRPHSHPFKYFTEPDVLVEEGPMLWGGIRLEAIWTPGHSPGHICLHDAQRRVLFSGDHVLPVITPHVGYQPPGAANPLADFEASLSKVENLDVDLVLPAHENPFPDLRGRVEAIKVHHHARLDKVLKAASGGEKSAYEVASLVPWDVGPWKKMPAWQHFSAVTECLAHLEYLVPGGKVNKLSRDGLLYYQVPGY